MFFSSFFFFLIIPINQCIIFCGIGSSGRKNHYLWCLLERGYTCPTVFHCYDSLWASAGPRTLPNRLWYLWQPTQWFRDSPWFVCRSTTASHILSLRTKQVETMSHLWQEFGTCLSSGIWPLYFCYLDLSVQLSSNFGKRTVVLLTWKSILDKALTFISIRLSTVRFIMSLFTLVFIVFHDLFLSRINPFFLSLFSLRVAAGSSYPFQ